MEGNTDLWLLIEFIFCRDWILTKVWFMENLIPVEVFNVNRCQETEKPNSLTVEDSSA